MAERRMFTKKVTDDDNFMSLSSSAQALYLHLSMSADDDGFCNQVNVSMFKAHASIQDLQALLEKRYIYQFENGVIVIKHWRMANALRKDRYTPTAFQKELAQLGLKENGSYTWLPDGCQTVANCLPQDSIDQNSIEKNREDKVNNIISSTASKPVSTPSSEGVNPVPFISLPLNDNTEYPIWDELVGEYESLYPAVDVKQALRNMKAWLMSNPKNRKTKSGIKRFINGWLAKDQNTYHPANGRNSNPKTKYEEIDSWSIS